MSVGKIALGTFIGVAAAMFLYFALRFLVPIIIPALIILAIYLWWQNKRKTNKVVARHRAF